MYGGDKLVLKKPVPHFNEPLSLPLEIGTNFKTA